MSPSERLREMAKAELQVWYPSVFNRDIDPDMYEELSCLDPIMIHRLGTCEYRIEYVSEDNVFVTYRHLDEV